MTEPTLPQILAQFDPEDAEGPDSYIDPSDVKQALTWLWDRTVDVRHWETFEPSIQVFDNVSESFMDDITGDSSFGRFQVIGNGMSPETARCSGWSWIRINSPTAAALGTGATNWGFNTMIPGAIVQPLRGEAINSAKAMVGHGEVAYTVSGPTAKSLPFHLYPGYMRDYIWPGIFTSPGNDDFAYDAGYDIRSRITAAMPLTTSPLEIRVFFDFECQYIPE